MQYWVLSLHVPVEHVLPAQQWLPGVPHWVHPASPHTSVGEPHMSPAQQGWPAPPHVAQTLFAQPRPAPH